MTEAEFRTQLKNGLCGAYLFFGDEEYLKRFYAGRAEVHTLGSDAGDNEFGARRIDSDISPDAAVAALEEALFTPSMLGGKVFVRYTQRLSEYNAEQTKALVALLKRFKEQDDGSAILIIIAPNGGFDAGNYKKNRPSAALKTYSEVCTPVDLSGMTPGELKKWMQRRLGASKVLISAEACDALAARCTSDMYLLSGELDKLSAFALSRAEKDASQAYVSPADVELVCCKNDEDEAFALANAVLSGNRQEALRQLGIKKAARENPVAVLAGVIRSVCDMAAVSVLASEGADRARVASELKMHEYRAGLYLSAVRGIDSGKLAAAVDRCRKADVLLKSSKLDYIALERLVCTIPGKPRALGKQ